jgi:hypothetical protein
MAAAPLVQAHENADDSSASQRSRSPAAVVKRQPGLEPIVTRQSTELETLRVSGDGYQPQAVADAQGAVHLVYFQGEPGSGDLFYLHRPAGQTQFSAPIRINSLRGSAIALGAVRGGQLALGKNRRIHVVWNGSGREEQTKGVFYARLNSSATTFEPQRNLMRRTQHADGGGTVAADHEGNVYGLWHGHLKGERGEGRRKLWAARSTDDGQMFSLESPVWAEPTGACACCSTRALTDREGVLYALYRSANAEVNRDIYLIASTDRGESFQGVLLHEWKAPGCPMSTMALAEGPRGVVAAWETNGQIYFASITAGVNAHIKPLSAPGTGKNRKHPALAFDQRGAMILVWTEGTDWAQGGDLVWQVFDQAGQPSGGLGRIHDGIPVWGLPTAIGGQAGFTVIH